MYLTNEIADPAKLSKPQMSSHIFKSVISNDLALHIPTGAILLWNERTNQIERHFLVIVLSVKMDFQTVM